MKKFKKILLSLFLFFVCLMSCEIKSKSLRDLIFTYTDDSTFTLAQRSTFTLAQRNELINDIDTFIELKKRKMSDSNLWLVDRKQYPNATNFCPESTWFDGEYEIFYLRATTNKFMPFAEKLIVAPGSEIVFIGDLHGNLKSLLYTLEDLKKLGYLDQYYRNKKENVSYVFLGDYVDRNSHDLQLLSVLFKFYNENSNNVFLLRGNHEVLFHNKEDVLYKLAFNDLPFYKKIHCAFEFLPLAIYLGCPNTNFGINFLQCCHGGIEIGYNPKNLLASSAASYQRILELNRCDFLNNLQRLDRKLLGDIGDQCYTGDESLEHLYSNIPEEEFLNLTGLGFCWSDFNTCFDLSIDTGRGAFIFGKKITEYYLEQSGSSEFKLCGILRGHQHSGSMVDQICANKGLLHLWNGLVYTLISTSFDNPDIAWTGKSFAILKVDAIKEKWKIKHFCGVKKRDGSLLERIKEIEFFSGQMISLKSVEDDFTGLSGEGVPVDYFLGRVQAPEISYLALMAEADRLTRQYGAFTP